MSSNFNLELTRMTFSNSDMKMDSSHNEQHDGEKNFLSTNINLNQKFNKNKIKSFKLKLFINKCV